MAKTDKPTPEKATAPTVGALPPSPPTAADLIVAIAATEANLLALKTCLSATSEVERLTAEVEARQSSLRSLQADIEAAQMDLQAAKDHTAEQRQQAVNTVAEAKAKAAELISQAEGATSEILATAKASAQSLKAEANAHMANVARQADDARDAVEREVRALQATKAELTQEVDSLQHQVELLTATAEKKLAEAA